MFIIILNVSKIFYWIKNKLINKSAKIKYKKNYLKNVKSTKFYFKKLILKSQYKYKNIYLKKLFLKKIENTKLINDVNFVSKN